MIVGIGVDLVRVERLKRSLERFGERFAEKVLGADELEGFRCAPRPAHFLAKRFAAKEAAAKALGTGFRAGLTLPQIQVENDPLGRPLLRFTGCAAQLIAERRVTAAHLSLSDEEEHAIAYVVLERVENHAKG